MNSSQHILIIGKVWPEPGSSAAGSRTLQLINLFLSADFKISFASTAGDSPYKSNLGLLGISEYAIELNHNSFDSFISFLNPSVVIFDRFTMEEQFGWRVAEQCPGALRVLDTIDLHCLRIARHQALKDNREFTLKDLDSDTAKRELASIYRCDLSLMISEVEMELLQDHFKVDASLLHYIPFLPDPLTEKDLAGWPGFEARQHFMTIGNFLHEPNWDAVLYLKQSIWPLIRQQLPKTEMHVYGAYPSHKVFQLHNPKERFLIKGRADDASDVMLKARVCLAPLRFGAGIKGKLLDAMLYGTPSVTTNIGAESMHGRLPWNGAIEETAKGFAEAAVKLYTEETTWKQAQQNGIQIINIFFSKEEHSKKLLDRFLSVQNNVEAHRLKNFTGAMLMHHTISGIKYMALWIEAKNKINNQA